MKLFSFLHRPARRTARRIPRKRLSLECLEDRSVPSTLFVTKTADDVTMPGTLRYAVAHAKNGDDIQLNTNALKGPIVLTQGELLVDKDVTISTHGSGMEAISGNHASRVFEVAAGAHVSLVGL